MTENISPLRALLNSETSTALPKISNAQLLEDPQNKEVRDLWVLPAENPELLSGRKIAVVATDGVEEIELTTILHYFRTRGATIDLISPKMPTYPNFLGLQIPATRATHILAITYIAPGGWIPFDKHLEDVSAADYDAVIIPGGSWNPDTLRSEAKAITFVQEIANAGKVVAAICHGPWVLSDAGVLRGKRVTAWWSTKPDLENAGATFEDKQVVVDGNVVTSRAPIDLAAFVHAVTDLLVTK